MNTKGLVTGCGGNLAWLGRVLGHVWGLKSRRPRQMPHLGEPTACESSCDVGAGVLGGGTKTGAACIWMELHYIPGGTCCPEELCQRWGVPGCTGP